jgi:hydrogenase maturation protease
MRTLYIACGNPLRGDDGAASEVLQLLASVPDRQLRTVHQLTPELAGEMARFDRIVFIDADANAAATGVSVEPVAEAAARSPLTHFSTPAEIIALSRGLFGFAGEALLCRIPAGDFSPGETLSPRTRRLVREAADQLAPADRYPPPGSNMDLNSH